MRNARDSTVLQWKRRLKPASDTLPFAIYSMHGLGTMLTLHHLMPAARCNRDASFANAFLVSLTPLA